MLSDIRCAFTKIFYCIPISIVYTIYVYAHVGRRVLPYVFPSCSQTLSQQQINIIAFIHMVEHGGMDKKW